MKNIILVFAFLITSLSILAQESTYQPLVREGVRWYYDYIVANSETDELYITKCYLEFKGDSIYKNNTYKCCYLTSFDKDGETTRLKGIMMEKDKVVYSPEYLEISVAGNRTEYGCVYYDFKNPSGTLQGTVNINGTPCKQYKTTVPDDDEPCYLTEGIGIEFDAYSRYNSSLFEPYGIPCTCTVEKYYLFDRLEDLNGNVLYRSMKSLSSAIDDITNDKKMPANDNMYYNLQGQAVDIKSAPAGIYIHNGKKVVVK